MYLWCWGNLVKKNSTDYKKKQTEKRVKMAKNAKILSFLPLLVYRRYLRLIRNHLLGHILVTFARREHGQIWPKSATKCHIIHI